MICSECKKECETRKVDNGIGSYDYMGQHGSQHEWGEESLCCGAETKEGDDGEKKYEKR